MMKVLSIGNSFSQDAHHWLKQICESAGFDIHCVNLYIGGCSLEMHCRNLESNEDTYELEINGKTAYDLQLSGSQIEKTSILNALRSDKWDVVTLQQVSSLSGRPQSYFPYLCKLAEFVKKECGEARIYWHQTWSYEQNSLHPNFIHYNCDQKEMYRRGRDCALMAAKLIGAEIIPAGDVIQRLRDNVPEFDFAKTGRSLNRDGFHLSELYGRYAAALIWYYCLCGGDIGKVDFIPQENGHRADVKLIEAIKDAVKEFLKDGIQNATDSTDT